MTPSPEPVGSILSTIERSVGPAEPPAAAPTRDQQIASTLRHAGVPERYLDVSFANWRDTEGSRAAFRAATATAERPANLILIGPWGSGKTRLSVSILRARVDRWLDAYPVEVATTDDGIDTRPPFRSRFEGVPQLLDAIRRGFEFEGEADPLPALLRAPMLVLDDLGREKATDWVLERLYVLVDTRYGANLPTVMTTNYSLEDLAKRDYGAVVSRLTEGGKVVRLTADDQRMRR